MQGTHYDTVSVYPTFVNCLLQINTLQKVTQESSQSTQQSSVQHQPTVQYAIPNKKAAKNQDQWVSIFKPAMRLSVADAHLRSF